MLDLGEGAQFRCRQRCACGRVGGPRRAEVAESAKRTRPVPGSLGRREREHRWPLRFVGLPSNRALSLAKFCMGLLPVACTGIGDREQRC